jgi:VWFA-related protein
MSRSRYVTRAVVFYFLLTTFYLHAQQPPPRFETTTSIDIVSVPVTVTNRAGRFVSGLTAADFEISEDGRRRTPAQFSAERVPVSFGILLDISGSMASDPKARALDDARWADTRRALELLVSRLDPRDEIFFAVFSNKVGLAVPWTRDHQQVLRAFSTLRPGGNTAIFDAVSLIAPAFQLAQHPRKILLVISDGRDSRVPHISGAPAYRYPPTPEQQVQIGIYQKQKERRDIAVSATQHVVKQSEVALYAIGMGTGKGAYINHINLEALTANTGGYVEAINDPSEITAALARLCDELQSQYMLTFEPAHSDGKHHEIEVTTKNRDLRVRARAGYVARGK